MNIQFKNGVECSDILTQIMVGSLPVDSPLRGEVTLQMRVKVTRGGLYFEPDPLGITGPCQYGRALGEPGADGMRFVPADVDGFVRHLIGTGSGAYLRMVSEDCLSDVLMYIAELAKEAWREAFRSVEPAHMVLAHELFGILATYEPVEFVPDMLQYWVEFLMARAHDARANHRLKSS